MISGSLLMIYSILCILTGLYYLKKRIRKFSLYFFLVTHSNCFILSVFMLLYKVPFWLTIPLLILVLASRLLNGLAFFHRVHVSHHILSAIFFITIVMLQIVNI